MFEDLEPDISTERLMGMVEDHTGYDAGDISTALAMRAKGKEATSCEKRRGSGF